MRTLLIILVLMSMIILNAVQPDENNNLTKNQKELIEKVEKSLKPRYYIEGDKLKSITEAMEEYNIPGLSLAVIDNFEVVWAKGYGVADTETKNPVDKHTIFQAASISKPVTALAVMKMVQDGKWDLDENINTYLKSRKLPENGFTKKKAVTLKNLLSHNAGVTVHGFPGYKPDAVIPNLVQVLEGEDPANTNKIFVDTEPETINRYSGGGTTIVQQAMIDLKGKSFEEIMQETVLTPLEMNNSFFSQSALNEEQCENATAGHYNDGTQVVGKRHLYPEMAAAGLWTTAEDLAKYAVEIQKSLKDKSNKILSQEYAEIMTTPVLNGEYNIGLGNTEFNNEMLLEHGGGNEGYVCYLLFHREKGFGFAIMTNSSNYSEITLPLFRILDEVYSWETYGSENYEKEITLSEVEMKKFSGRYKIAFDRSIKIFKKNDKLFYKMIYEGETEISSVSKNTLISSDRNNKLELKENFDGIVFNNSEYEKLPEDSKLLEDFIEKNEVEEAVKWLNEQIKNDEKMYDWIEEYLNNIGYYLISGNKFKPATFLLKINTILYPESANVWDSLGEVYFFDKKFELAIKTMEKALEVNPNNQNAKEKIKQAKGLIE